MPGKLRYKSTIFAYLHKNGNKVKITIKVPQEIVDALVDSGLGLNEVFCQGIYRLMETEVLDLPGINVQEKRKTVITKLKDRAGRYAALGWD